MNEVEKCLIELIRACVFSKPSPLGEGGAAAPDRVCPKGYPPAGDKVQKPDAVGYGIPDVPKAVIQLAQKHDLAHLLGQQNEDYYKAVFRCDKQTAALAELEQKFDSAGIDYVPLKGAVIRNLYPQPWMRSSCDIDILVHENEIEKILQLLNEKEAGRTSQHIAICINDVHVELHTSLSDEVIRPKIDEVLDEAWNHTLNHAFDSAFFYFYFIAHLARHFSYGGGGIRPFIDLQFIERDHALLHESGLEKFALECEMLSDHWFKGTEDYNADLEDFVMNSALYSDLEKWAQIGAASEGRAKHFFSRLFMPYDKLKNEYPVLKNNKWLLPACEAARILRVVKRGRVKEHIAETKEIVSSDNIKMARLMNELEL